MAVAGAKVLTCGRGERPDNLPAAAHRRQADVANSRDADALVAVAGRLGPVTVLVNNAGIQVEKTVVDTTDADWDQLIGINCRGIFNLCRAFLAQPDVRGSIVTFGSISGDVADPSMAIDNASKAFVHGLARSVAVDHGPAGRCNAIRSGWIQTGMLEAGFALSPSPVGVRADALARHAARCLGRPEDIANAVAWLVSDQSGLVTGQCYTIDGGLTAASPPPTRTDRMMDFAKTAVISASWAAHFLAAGAMWRCSTRRKVPKNLGATMWAVPGQPSWNWD